MKSTSKAAAPIKTCWLVWTALSVMPAHGQTGDRREVRLSLQDRTIEAQVLNKQKNVRFEPDREYFWCKGQRIMTTQGGAAGDLLDGRYREFHLNGQLMAQGKLSYGLRAGKWLEWDEQGRLTSEMQWKAGRKHGNCIQYDVHGGKPLKQRYRAGRLVKESDPGQVKKEKRKKTASAEDGCEDGTRKPVKPSKDLKKREKKNKGTKEEELQKQKKKAGDGTKPEDK